MRVSIRSCATSCSGLWRKRPEYGHTPIYCGQILAWKNRVIKALRNKRTEIHGQIAAYQAQIAQAKHDLAHVNATIRMFTDVGVSARATWEPRPF